MKELFVPDIYHRNMKADLLPRDATQYPFVFECDEPSCYWHTSHESWGQAANTRLNHRASTCPLGSSSRIGKFGNPVGSSMIEKFWNQLDRQTKELVETSVDARNTQQFFELRGKAQGIALCIWTLCTPYFDTPEDVARWAMQRYKMEHKGAEFQPTLGVAGYNPPVPATTPQQELSLGKRPEARRAVAAPAPSSDEQLAKLDEKTLMIATNAIKAGFADYKVLMLTKMSAPVLRALKDKIAKDVTAKK